MSSSDTQPAVCPECGASVPVGARVCPQCRVRLTDDVVASGGRSDTIVESSMVKQLDQERGRQGLGPAARRAGAPGDAPRRTFERKYGAGAKRKRDEKNQDSTPLVSAELVESGRERPARTPSTDRVERAAARRGPVDRLEPGEPRGPRRALDRVERQPPAARDASAGADRMERRGPPVREAAVVREAEPAPAGEPPDRSEDAPAPARGDDRFEAAPAEAESAVEASAAREQRPGGAAPRAVALVATELEDALEGGLRFGHDVDLADKLSLLSSVALLVCTLLPFSGTRMGILVGAGPLWLLTAATVALVVLRQRLRARAAEGMIEESSEGEAAPSARPTDPAAVRRLNLLQIVTGAGAVTYLLVVALGIYLVDTSRLDLRFGWFAALFFAMGLSYSGIARFVRDAVGKAPRDA